MRPTTVSSCPCNYGLGLTLVLDLYLRDPSEMQHAVELLLESELFEFHYERMVGIMMGDAQEVS